MPAFQALIAKGTTEGNWLADLFLSTEGNLII